MKGACTCGEVQFELRDSPLFIHACHCRWCQRETGSAFALNAIIEADKVALLSGSVEMVKTPSNSGRGQIYSRCPSCKIALWSVYAGAGADFRFVRVGVLENPDRYPPDIHIFTESKQPWVILPDNVPVMKNYYRLAEHWPEASQQRRNAVRERS